MVSPYTSRCNSDFVASGPAAQSFFGHLFCGRYKSLIKHQENTNGTEGETINTEKQFSEVPFCRGKSLRVGNFFVRAKSAEANFEIDLNHQEAPIVADSADAVALIEVAGVRIFPK